MVSVVHDWYSSQSDSKASVYRLDYVLACGAMLKLSSVTEGWSRRRKFKTGASDLICSIVVFQRCMLVGA